MSSLSVVVLDAATLTRGDLDLGLLDQFGQVTLYPNLPHADAPARIAKADIVLSNKVMLDARALEAAKNLKLICVCATGVNNVDLEAAKARGIRVTNVTGYSTRSVAQHVMTF